MSSLFRRAFRWPTMTCPIGTDVQRAARILKNGGLVAFGTETVYGLGADASDETAVARVFAVKGRPRFDPLIVHLADAAWLKRVVADIPALVQPLADRFWPGPLTLVLPKADRVPDLVTAGLPTAAVRVPDHPLALELLQAADIPVAAPSANPFGRTSPTTAQHVAEQLGKEIDYILEGGPCRVGLESTVLDLCHSPAMLLRPGGVTREEIESVVGPVGIPEKTIGHDQSAVPSPGMLTRHYAPATRLILVETISDLPETCDAGRVGVLALQAIDDPDRYAFVEVLSAAGDLIEAAAGFFAALRRLDAQKPDVIAAVRFPEEGLGHALNDRLRRAATND